MSKRAREETTGTEENHDPPAPDWRVELRHWTGFIGQEDVASQWKGAWLAKDGAFKTALVTSRWVTHSFNLTVADVDTLLDQRTEYTGSITGSYKLDNGDGPQDYSDVEHQIHAWPVVANPFMERWKLVGARGKDELGEFISIGALLLPSEYCSGFMLFLSRRYISDDDPRTKLTAKEVMQRCRASMVNETEDCDWREDPQEFLRMMHTQVPWKLAE